MKLSQELDWLDCNTHCRPECLMLELERTYRNKFTKKMSAKFLKIDPSMETKQNNAFPYYMI